LEKDILNNRDGDKNNLYYSLASGKRNENNGYDIETVKKDAQKLFNVINLYSINLFKKKCFNIF
jgi:hypothetical protein